MPGHYSFEKTFSAGGSKDALERLSLELISGVVHDIIIDFPAGCQYLCKVRIAKANTSIWPRNQGAYYSFEDFPLPIHDSWVLKEGESEMVLEGYNEDTTEDHTIRVTVQVSDPEIYFASLGLLARMDEFIKKQELMIGEV
jgi:hypothetical protein